MEPHSEADYVSRLSEILAEQRAIAAEQLTAGLKEELDRILEERFTEIARRVGAELEEVLARARVAQVVSPADSPDGTPPAEEQRPHLQAQRFARVKAAEMRLYRADAVARGRARQNLYAELRPEIDSAREAFRQEFVSACPSMRDYLHLELVHTLANDDGALLGPEYPGPLV